MSTSDQRYVIIFLSCLFNFFFVSHYAVVRLSKCFFSSSFSFFPQTNVLHSLVNAEMEDAEPQERKKETKQQGDFVDSSCRVMMLQSYVQFLCVQKVLKEAAAQTGIKKK